MKIMYNCRGKHQTLRLMVCNCIGQSNEELGHASDFLAIPISFYPSFPLNLNHANFLKGNQKRHHLYTRVKIQRKPFFKLLFRFPTSITLYSHALIAGLMFLANSCSWTSRFQIEPGRLINHQVMHQAPVCLIIAETPPIDALF